MAYSSSSRRSSSSSKRTKHQMLWPRKQADEIAFRVASSKVLERRQSAPQHIPRYSLPVTATDEEFNRLMEQRHNRMTEIASITIDGVPVTHPLQKDPKSFTYHIVELKDPAEGNSVEILFLERNLYYVAFRPRFEGDGRDEADPGGWFALSDAEMPGYLRYENVLYDSAYNGNIKETISTGRQCLQEIRLVLGNHTVQNRLMSTPERQRTHQAVMIMLSETQRFRSVQAHALNNLSNGTSLVGACFAGY